MKLSTPAVQISASDTAGTVLCGFDAEGTTHLMRLLSDLYSNAAAAVLREYSVNALDSHRAAGNPDPVEVTLPSDLNPVLVISDYGTGLSRDEMINVYSRYGASTKRGSNEQTGAFGLGSKSAFTLGQQFIVTAVRGGERTVAAFGVNQSGAGTVTILDHQASDAPNGVTVAISVDDIQAVRRAAGPVFAGWEPGTVLLDGERPRSILDDPTEIAEGIYLADVEVEEDVAWGDAGLIVVMGGICYPVSRSLRNTLLQSLPGSRGWHGLLTRQSHGQRVFAVVGIGDVDIAPSREEMRDTPRTLDRLRSVADAYSEGVEATVRRGIDSAPTMTAAARTVGKLRRSPYMSAALGDLQSQEWRGQPIPYEVRVPCASSDYSRHDRKCTHKRGSSSLFLGDSGMDQTLVITGVPDDRTEAALRAAKAFLAADETYQCLVFTPPGAKPVEWFAFGQPDTLPSMPFGEYMAETRERRPAPDKGGKPAETVRYTVFTEAVAHPSGEDGEQLTASEITGLGLPVVVAGSVTALSDGALCSQEFAQAVHDGVAVVALSGGRTLAALRRKLGEDVPVTKLGERADAVAARVAASYADGDRDLERVSASRQAASSLSPAMLNLRNRITNPAVIGVMDRLDRERRLTREERNRLGLIAGARTQWPSLFPPAEQPPNLLEEYPLLRAVQWRTDDGDWRDHVVAYLNAVG